MAALEARAGRRRRGGSPRPRGGGGRRAARARGPRLRISVVVQHHPRRGALLPALLAALVPAEVEVVSDPEPTGPPNPWRTYRLALELTPAWATHRLVVQDDAAPCRGFAGAAEAALAARPSDLVSFFVAGRPGGHARAVWDAARRGRSWAELRPDRWCSTVALAWPAALAAELLAFVDAQGWPPALRADDEIVGRFLGDRREGAWATVPSLVEHPDVEPSVVSRKSRGGSDPGRVAACWIGDCDPVAIDWGA